MARFGDEGARPAGLQLVFRRHPETGVAVEGRLRWGLIPHYAESSGKRYAISRRDGEVFGVAGIWENWRDPSTSTWERTFAVITVRANALIAPIHDRMLAILPNDQFARWLSAEEDPRDLLAPFPAEHLVVAAQRRRRP
jgi:putative SOS response-associated peptidase YedK